MKDSNIPTIGQSKPKLKPLPVVKERVVTNTNAVDLTPYRLFGTRVALDIPTEAEKSDKSLIIYTKLNMDIWYPVAQVGHMVNADFVKKGDLVRINPDLPINQIPVLELEGRKFLFLEWHEIIVVRDKDYVPTFNDKTTDELEG